MQPLARASLLRGVVAALSFLVLVQGYELVARLAVGLAAKVGVAAAGLSYGVHGRLEARSP